MAESKKKEKDNPHSGHRARMRGKFIKNGLEGFEDHEILELMLFYCIPMKDTNELAHRILDEYGGLDKLFEAHPLDIVNRCGVSEHTAVLFSLMPSLFSRYSISKAGSKVVITSSKAAGAFATGLFVDKHVETLYIICLNSKNRVLHVAVMSKGTLTSAPLYPRDYVDVAIKYRAVSVIIAHNHPSGDLTPSPADIEGTNIVADAYKNIGVILFDHIIVGGDRYYSFAENGKLKV